MKRMARQREARHKVREDCEEEKGDGVGDEEGDSRIGRELA